MGRTAIHVACAATTLLTAMVLAAPVASAAPAERAAPAAGCELIAYEPTNGDPNHGPRIYAAAERRGCPAGSVKLTVTVFHDINNYPDSSLASKDFTLDSGNGAVDWSFDCPVLPITAYTQVDDNMGHVVESAHPQNICPGVP